MYIYIYIHVYVMICVYMYIYIHIYTDVAQGTESSKSTCPAGRGGVVRHCY